MKNKLILPFILLLISTSVYAKRALVKVKKPISLKQLNVLNRNGVNIKLFDDINSDYFNSLYLVEGKEKEIEILGQRLKAVSIEYPQDVYAQGIIPTASVEDKKDPFYKYQWGFQNQEQTLLVDEDDIHSRQIHGEKGIDIGINEIKAQINSLLKKEVVVAVLDTGVDYEHKDLKENISKNLIECDSAGNPPFRAKEDNDNNGYKGDCLGWNFTAPKEGNNRPLDDKGHGTHVGGIISAISDNEIGVKGLSNKIKILPIKVLKKSEGRNRPGDGFTDRVAKGILYAIKKKVDVINMSLGWPSSLETAHVKEAIEAAIDAGITLVAAAGNNSSNRPIFPCSYRGVLCVGAITANGDVAAFSNRGSVVDVLAPGEQILSTYPNRIEPSFFSVVGYEIKNGTSQAAPYVAGKAALIKGVFPEIDSHEVIGRILKSSRPGNQKDSLRGLINISASLKTGVDKAFIYPVLKGDGTIQIDPSSLKTNLKFPLRSYFQESNKVKVTVVDSPDIEWEDNQIEVEKIEQNKTFEIEFKGNLKSSKVSNEQLITFKIQNEEGEETLYSYNFILAKDVSNLVDEEKISFPKEIKDVGAVRNGKVLSKIRTVDDRFRSFERPEYWIFNKRENSTLTIYDIKDKKFESKKVTLEQSERILSIVKLDLNYDQKADYLIRTLAKIDDEQFIFYYFLNSNLKSLVPGIKSFKFKPKYAFVNLNKTAFVPVKVGNVVLASPLFETNGSIPEWDRNPDPWVDEVDGDMKRIYYLKFSQSGDVKEHLLTDYRFENEVVRLSSGNWNESVSIIGLLYQSSKDFLAGRARVLFSYGDGPYQKYYVLEIERNLETKIYPFNNNGSPLGGHFMVPLTKIEGNKVEYFQATAFAGMQNDYLGEYLLVSPWPNSQTGIPYRIEYNDKRDHVLGIMASFQVNGVIKSFVQTKTHLVVFDLVDGQAKISRHPIHRVSFIPGSVFNELFYPVVAGSEEKKAAFYIDATQLHSRHLYLLESNDEGLKSTVENSLLIPENCVPMNPVKLDQQENFSLFCHGDNGFFMGYVPML